MLERRIRFLTRNFSHTEVGFKYRGHSIELMSDDEWVYSDTKESVRLTHESRTCGHCNQPRTVEGHDMCLGELRGIMNACCGHGEVNDAYVQFLDGFCIRERDAKIVLGILKKYSPQARGVNRITQSQEKHMIDISGIDKGEVLAALYNGAKAPGLTFFQERGRDMTDDEARVLLAQRTYFDYLYGRVMKVDLGTDNFDPRGYDRDNGPGAAKHAIDRVEQNHSPDGPTLD